MAKREERRHYTSLFSHCAWKKAGSSEPEGTAPLSSSSNAGAGHLLLSARSVREAFFFAVLSMLHGRISMLERSRDTCTAE